MSALGEEPQSPVSRRSKGGIRVKVTPETIEVLAGRAVLAEPQE
jgi:hypothetical protein